MDREDPAPPRGVRRADIDELVEPAGPQQRGVDQGRPVGRADHDDVLKLLEPVHLGEDRVDHPLGDLRLAEPAAARGHEAVELVDEDDRRRDLAGAIEQARDLLLAFAVPFAQEVRRFGGDEIRLALARRGLGEQGLAGARRAVEQEALGRADAEPAEGVGMLQAEARRLPSGGRAASSRPPISSQRICGASTITSRIAEGWTRFSAFSKSLSSTESASRISVGIVSSARLIRGMIRRTASSAASRHSAARSAPTKP